MSLKRNVVANYVGTGWRALMSLAFVPLYIDYLGIEAYGLIGTYAVLQAWLALFDMGMKPALSREMARFTGGGVGNQSIWNLLCTVEVVVVCIAVFVGLATWFASGWLASDWLQAEELPLEVVTHAISLMGLVVALRFVEGIYLSSLLGLQRQVLQNALTAVMATLRGAGAVALLEWVSPTISAFFLWQAAVSLMTVALGAAAVRRSLPAAPRRPRPSLNALRSISSFAGGMMATTVLAILLTQIDKVLLMRLLSLDDFGRYALAALVGNALLQIVAPLTAAFYPRMVELVTQADQTGLRSIYHLGAQLVTVCAGSAAVVLIVFSDVVLLAWTGDAELAGAIAPLTSLLVAGGLLNALVWMPYQMQLAHGWTSLTVFTNSVAVAVVIPTLLWVVPRYGMLGAGWVWASLNLGYIMLHVQLIHRRLLRNEKVSWYCWDVGLPLAMTFGVVGVLRWLLPVVESRIGQALVIALVSGCALLTAAVSASAVRGRLIQLFVGWRSSRGLTTTEP